MSDYEKHGIYAAPWTEHGAEYLPVSVRSGRMVAQSTAELDYAQSIHAVATDEHAGGGLWDHDEDTTTRQKELTRMQADGRKISSAWPHKALGRYDDERMIHFVGNGARLTAHQYEIYKLFWEGRMSYGTIARRIGCARDRVREAVKLLRRKSQDRIPTIPY